MCFISTQIVATHDWVCAQERSWKYKERSGFQRAKAWRQDLRRSGREARRNHRPAARYQGMNYCEWIMTTQIRAFNSFSEGNLCFHFLGFALFWSVSYWLACKFHFQRLIFFSFLFFFLQVFQVYSYPRLVS